MRLDPKRREELFDLLDSLVDEQLDDAGQERLAQVLDQSEEAQGLYIAEMNRHANLVWDWGMWGNDGCGMKNGGLPTNAASADVHHSDIPSSEALMPPIIIDTSGPFSPPFSVLPSPLGGWLFSYAAATVIMGMAILGTWAYKVSLDSELAHERPRPAPRDTDVKPAYVGRITGMVDCQWADPDDAPRGSAIPLGGKYALAAGLMEITYQSGAKVILQGPCTYEVESASGGFLSVGRLTARMETKGEDGRGKAEEADDRESGIRNPESPFPLPPSPFVVHTPTATVTDLGTEFGVEVTREGTTTSHVFRGLVKVQLAGGGERATRAVLLRENESARVEKDESAAGARFVQKAAADPNAFVRRLVEPPKTLDLLDVVAGGSGTGNHRDRGIDPLTGLAHEQFALQMFAGDRHYSLVFWNRLIDGVFIPDGRAGPVQLDSARHAFDGFPETDGRTYGSIWPRAADFKPEEAVAGPKHQWMYVMGQGGQFMPGHRGLLGLCANSGITLKLDVMRQMYQGVRPARFRAVAGLADAKIWSPKADGMADIWVFVDGQLKFNRMHLRPQDGTVSLDVELGPTDRFLTLASTDGGNGCNWDTVVFGDPVVEMASTEAERSARRAAVLPAAAGQDARAPAGNRKEGRSMNE